MARVLFLMLPEQGHVQPTFHIARQLARRGHQVTYAATIDLLPIIRARAFASIELLREQFQPDAAGDLALFIAKLRPDLVLVDRLYVDTHASALARHAVSTLLVNTSLPDEREGGLPPITCAYVPTRSLAGALSVELAWLRVLLKRWAHFLKTRSGRCPRLRYEAPEIVLCAQEFDFDRPARNSRAYVGPSVELERPASAFPWTRLVPTARLIYCTFGTQSHRYRRRNQLFGRIAEAVAMGGNEQLVISDPDASRLLLGLPAEKLVLVETAPQLELLARASVAIVHGGLGSIKECILRGVPMLVLPQAFDQLGNAARVAYHGIGLSCRGLPGAQTIRRMLDELLVSDTIASRLRGMQRVFASQQSRDVAVEIIEREFL